MFYYEEFLCRVVIQVCIGLELGKRRYRSFSIRGLRPDAPDEGIAAVVRALAPLLEYPITKVTKKVQRKIAFDGPAAAPPPAMAKAAGVEEVREGFKGCEKTYEETEARAFMAALLFRAMALQRWRLPFFALPPARGSG